MPDFGRLVDGRAVRRLELGSAPGPVLHLLTLGATVWRLDVTCGDGHRRNVVLAHPSVDDHLASTDYLGATIGRYANRIAGGAFSLADHRVSVGINDRGNHLHGGPDGFDRRLWDVADHGRDHAVLRLDSPDGDQGFPGSLAVTVRFDVSHDGVDIVFEAVTDRTTVVNLTNHSYFNLDGDGSGTIDSHQLTVAAQEYTPVDPNGIPLGTHSPVAGTPFDFRDPHTIGPAVRHSHEQIVSARGVDHNYVLDGAGWRTAAVLESHRSGTRMEVLTDQPGLQVYTGNFLDGARPGTSGLYRQGDGIALEPQLFPDSPNHPEWPSPLLEPGVTYRSAMRWRFTSPPTPEGTA